MNATLGASATQKSSFSVGGTGIRRAAKCQEVIHIQVGKAGCQIGHEFWRDVCEEHQIEFKDRDARGVCTAEDPIYTDHLGVFFKEAHGRHGTGNQWVPRAILADLNMLDLEALTDKDLGQLYRPENIVGNDEGSGNCYAKAFHTEGPDLADRVLEIVRKEVDACDCLQGVQFCHAVGGGTGSGLTGLLLKTLYDYLDKSAKCILQTFTLVPSPGFADVVIEPYNAALSIQDLLEYCHQCFVYDNHALTGIVEKTLEKDCPKMSELNNIIAWCMSSITSGLRFSGPLNADLRNLQTNLVPFKNAHFLISGFAPLTATSSKHYRKISVLDLAQQMFSKDNVTVQCDPLNPGDPREEIMRARFLASWACWRGKEIKTAEVNSVLYDIQKPGARYDKFFPDWIPNAIGANICGVPHKEHRTCVCYISNNTAAHEVFDRIIVNWDNMYRRRSYLHVYEQDGISAQDMMESRNIVQYVSDEYCEFARWPDKLFDDAGVGLGRPVINDDAYENEEHHKILQELQELWGARNNGSGCMYIDAAGGHG